MDYRKTLAERLMEAVVRDVRMPIAICMDAGITVDSLYGYIDGRRVPRLASLLRLADTLDVSLDWLMGRTDEKKSAATLDSAET